MRPKTIQWQLTFSYALIALLATLLLGSILLVTLNNYYRQREVDYLRRYAQAVSLELQPILEIGLPPEVLEIYFSGLSLFSDARIRLYDAQRNLIADTGTPQSAQDQIVVALELPAPPGMFDVSEEINVDVDIREGEKTIVKHQTIGDQTFETVIVEKIIAPDRAVSSTQATTQTFTLSPDLPAIELLTLTGDVVSGTPHIFTSRLPRSESMFDLEYGPTGAETIATRSDQTVELAVVTPGGDALGYINVSQGPAYGRDIVRSVAIGWGVAGIIAVALAAAAGWLVSRRMSQPLLTLTDVTTRMANGDLSTRTDVNREDEIGQLGKSFNEMADQVEKTVTTLRHFVADAAHEIHTPLTALRTNLELLTEEVPPEPTHITRIKSQLDRLESLTANLLELSRLENQAPTNTQAFEPVLLNQILGELAESYASQADQRGITFEVRMPEQPIYTRGDKPQLSKAIGNLLDNALKFTPSKGVVTLRLEFDANHAEIHVEDTGIGIPAEDLPHLFNRFHRGRNTAAYTGSGLGLAITKTIIENYAGSISVKQLKDGSKFQVKLPGYFQSRLKKP